MVVLVVPAPKFYAFWAAWGVRLVLVLSLAARRSWAAMLVRVVWLGAIILLRLVGEAFSLAGTDKRAPRPDVERPRGPYADEDGSMRERFAERLMAFEASTGMPHDIVVLLAAPFVSLGALRWHVFRRRTIPGRNFERRDAGASRSGLPPQHRRRR